MNKAASALGKLARGVRKTLTPTQRKAQAERMRKVQAVRAESLRLAKKLNKQDAERQKATRPKIKALFADQPPYNF